MAKIQQDWWSWDCVHDIYDHGKPFRCLTVTDETTRFCLAIVVGRSLLHQHVVAVLRQLIVRYRRPRRTRSDNRAERVVHHLLASLNDQEILPSQTERGKPWQNGSIDVFNGTFRRECLDAELLHSLAEAQVVIENWRRVQNHERPHNALDYQVSVTGFVGAIT